MKFLIVFYMTVIFMINGCDVEYGRYENFPPDKPANLPESAFFAGGADGGDFFVIEHIDEHTIYATIYFDNGELSYEGFFSSENPIKNIDYTQSVIGWNDGVIYLKSGDEFKSKIPID